MKTASILVFLWIASLASAPGQVKYETEPIPAALQAKLDQVVGRVVYSCAREGILLLTTKEQDGQKVRFYGAKIAPRYLSVLSPWKIVGVDKVGDISGRYLMAIRLDALGVPMVISGVVIAPADLSSATDPIRTVATAARLSTSIRETTGERFTDVDAVMHGDIHSGMTEQEMVCGLGDPERVNSDETTTQNIYQDGSLIVYTSNGRVTNVQHFSAP